LETTTRLPNFDAFKISQPRLLTARAFVYIDNNATANLIQIWQSKISNFNCYAHVYIYVVVICKLYII